MTKCIYTKLVAIILLLIVSLTAVVGAFLIRGVRNFYVNEFYTRMQSVFSDTELAADLRAAAEEAGVPGDMILTDPESRNTRENLENARRALMSEGADPTVLIVSSDYHVPRAIALAEDAGFKAAGLGSPCKPEYWIKNHFRETLAWVKYWAVKYLHLPL